jgi:hypothetical protein
VGSSSAAAVRAGIAAIELLDVELLARQSGTTARLRVRGTKIDLIGGIAAPFAEAAPETAEQTRGGF